MTIQELTNDKEKIERQILNILTEFQNKYRGHVNISALDLIIEDGNTASIELMRVNLGLKI